MKKLFYPALVFSAFTLTACGGGGGGDDSNDRQPLDPDSTASKLVSSAQVIDYYGDSTVFGWATSAADQVDITAPEAFAAALQNSALHSVNNKGVSGQTACDLLNGVNLERNWAAEMDQSTATVVILNHGINDAVSDNAVSLEEYRSCLTSLAQIAKAEGKRVVFETPNPVDNAPALPTFVQTMGDVARAEGLPLIDQFTYLNQRYASDLGSITRDGTHPTDAVYIEKGQYAASRFNTFNR